MESPIENEEMMIDENKFETDITEKNINQIDNRLNQNNHLDNKPKLINYRVNFNSELKSILSVANAKFTDDSKGSYTKYVEVVFSDKRKKVFKNEHHLFIQLFEYVIVQVDSGLEYGTVVAIGNEAEEKVKYCHNCQEPEQIVVRHAHSEDMDKIKRNISLKPQTIEQVKEMISQFKLDMKINDAEWQFDRQKLIIFFTAPQRIDFRELVKELARNFKTRIELRQISNREEARRIGGMGPCGLNLCCSSFGNENCHVTLDHAKHQQLSNNISKLSGYCGRLKCCLLYEHDSYIEILDKYPAINSTVNTKEGAAFINKIDVFKETATLFYPVTGSYRSIPGESLLEYQKDGKVIPPPEEEPRKTHSDYTELSELESEY
jgi:cell fate regulator YaaT (PSP1 superfamily)